MLCMLGMASATFANAQCNQETIPYVEVNATAEKEVAPDVFYLRVDIDEADSKGKKSLESQQKELVDALNALDINTGDALTRLSLNSSFYTKKSNLASASYQIKLTSAEQVSMVWQKLDAVGFSKVSFIRAEYSQIEELRNQVRCEAICNAQSQARSMAEAIGQGIGKCFYISCGYSGGGIVYAQPRLMAKSYVSDSANGIAEEAEIIDFNNIKVSASVSAKFLLK